jgi:PDZ domain/Aspartyl protease
MKKLIVFAIALLCFFMHSVAQEQFSEPQSRLITRFPFRQLSGGVILVQGIVNQYPDTLNFILDTGSGGISLDSTTCDFLKIKLEESDRTIRGIGGIKKVSFLNHAILSLPGLRVDSLNFHVNDYGILTAVYGLKIDGIIGYSFLSRYIVRIDYDSSRIEVHSPGEYKYQKGGHILRPLITSIPVQTLRIKESRTITNRYYFDTGAGLCLLLSDDFVKDSAVMRTKRKKNPVMTQAEGLGGKMQMELTTVKEVRLGPYRFHNVPTYIFNDEYNVTSYPFLGGLLGNDLLRRFNTTLNYRKREIHIIPNSHYGDLFDYAYTGLGVYYVDGKIVIEDIVPGSPGAKAGFKPGDIILGINNNFTNNIIAYKSLMQSAGERLKFIIIRDGSPHELIMRPKSIL